MIGTSASSYAPIRVKCIHRWRLANSWRAAVRDAGARPMVAMARFPPAVGVATYGTADRTDDAITAADRATSSAVVDQFENDTRMAGSPFQAVPPTQHVPSAWIDARASAVALGSSSPISTWLSTTSLRTRMPGAASSASAICRARAQQRSTNWGHAAAPERAQRSVDGEGARPARSFGDVGDRFPPLVRRRQVRAGNAHGRPVHVR